jgi:hypothetical protein
LLGASLLRRGVGNEIITAFAMKVTAPWNVATRILVYIYLYFGRNFYLPLPKLKVIFLCQCGYFQTQLTLQIYEYYQEFAAQSSST